MHVNKLFKNLIIILPAILIASCSSNKSISNSQNGNKPKLGISNNTNFANDHINVKEQVKLRINQLQQHNIIYFDLNKYNIRPEFSGILDDHAKFLRANPSYKITIEGHTDERGTPEYNIALGERRANSVMMYLQSKGVSNEQISVISYGKEKPVALGHNEQVYAKNRRSVLTY